MMGRGAGREGVPAQDWDLGWECHRHGHSWSHTDPDEVSVIIAIPRRRNQGREKCGLLGVEG